MKEPPAELKKRLLFILHRAFIEARLLAQAKNHSQLFALVDAVEEIPAYLTRWEDSHLEAIRFNLKTYQDRYQQGRFDYLPFLSDWEVPEF
jgi:hypothetical protein